MTGPKTITTLPTGVECNADYHLLAQNALWHLLEKISGGEQFSQADCYVGEFLRPYLRAWHANMPKDFTGSLYMELRGLLLLLDAKLENRELSEYDEQGQMGLADTLIQFVHQWQRDLKSLVR